jgi:hypothetical protein
MIRRKSPKSNARYPEYLIRLVTKRLQETGRTTKQSTVKKALYGHITSAPVMEALEWVMGLDWVQKKEAERKSNASKAKP